MARVRIFVDFWNFQLHWNRLVGKTDSGDPVRIPWKHDLPRVICGAVTQKTGEASSYAGTHVYASVDPQGDTGLRKFLHVMDSFPGYSVNTKERKSRSGKIRCSNCANDFKECPKCNKPLRRTVEKGIDAAILTDLIQMAFDGVYDAAVLASLDGDLAQGVTFVQNRIGKQVYQLWFPGVGHDLRNACWDHFSVQDLLEDLGINTE